MYIIVKGNTKEKRHLIIERAEIMKKKRTVQVVYIHAQTIKRIVNRGLINTDYTIPGKKNLYTLISSPNLSKDINNSTSIKPNCPPPQIRHYQSILITN